MAEVDHESFEQDFSDYYDRDLPAPRQAEVEAHLAGCERCRGEYDRFKEAVGALSGLHKMAAPGDLTKQVKNTIHRRSAGRFFGRKAFGDRVPFSAIAVVALIVAAVAYLLVKNSSTGTIHEPLKREQKAPEAAPGAEEVMPKP